MMRTYTDARSIPASFLQAASFDPASKTEAPPNYGQPTLPHIFTISARYGASSRAYQWADEALRHSRENAEAMRTECGIMECLEARQRTTALLNWHLEGEDKDHPKQKEIAETLTRVLKRTRRFLDMRRCLLEAEWYGRYATAHQFSKLRINGKWRTVLSRWEPRHGDKLVFRFDDGTFRHDPDQVGIRVGAGYQIAPVSKDAWGNERRKVEATQYGLVYWLDKHERKTIAVHKHIIEDGPFNDGQRSGAIHGVGIRDRIYWTWYGMQECLAHLLNYLERTALGIEIWRYPMGNVRAQEETAKAARERSAGGSVVLVPVPPGENADWYGVEHIEPGLGGIDALKTIIQEYFSHKIKRYILGQTLTSEAEATGLGSGVADAHMATFSDIIKYDATKLEETLTEDVVAPLQEWNCPGTQDHLIRFVIDTESDESQEKLEAYKGAWEMGLAIKTEDLYSVIGASKPGPEDETLQNEMAGKPPTTFGPMGDGTALDDMSGKADGKSSPNGNGQDRKFDRYRANGHRERIESAVADVHREPTEAQREAGNYSKGHLFWNGLNISIENPKGTKRRPEWPELAAHYGYIRGSTGRDDDHVDIFMGPHPESDVVFVIDQETPGGRFDEHKCLLGFVNQRQAKRAYLDSYSPGWRCGPITAMTVKQFKAWLNKGDQRKRIEPQVSQYSASRFQLVPSSGLGGSRYELQDQFGNVAYPYSTELGRVLTDEEIERAFYSRQRSLFDEPTQHGDRAEPEKTKPKSGDEQKRFHWVTIRGTHVQIDGESGEIAKGPAGLKGKQVDELDKDKPDDQGETETPSKPASIEDLKKDFADFLKQKNKQLDSINEGNARANEQLDDLNARTNDLKQDAEGGDRQELLDDSESPRDRAEKQRQLDSDYEFARASAISNRGEDLKGSARHKVNAWRSLQDAENESGDAAQQYATKAHLMKADPPNFISHVDHNFAGAMLMHYAMSAFPAKAGYGNDRRRATISEEENKKDRQQYVETWKTIKSAAEEIAATEKNPKDAIEKLKDALTKQIRALRQQTGQSQFDAKDKYNNTANALIPMLSSLQTYGRVKKNSPMGRMAEFMAAVREKYPDAAQAAEQIKDHAKDIMEGRSLPQTFGKKGEKKKTFDPADAYVKHATRKGGRNISEHLKTANQAADWMVGSLKMRGVQWGNSVTDDERAHHAIKAAEAFADLSDVLGLDDSHASLNGIIGLAIGARGHGTAMAHYEPGTKVINLTRKNGVGSLAHEWGHAFDHMLAGGTMSRGVDKLGANYFSEQYHRTEKFEKDESGNWKPVHIEQTPVHAAYKQWGQAYNASLFRRRLGEAIHEEVRAGRLSKSKAQYWRSEREVFARSFERYVQHKLRSQGRDNTYLAGVMDHAFWPNDQEIAAMAPAFDAIFEAYRTSQAPA